MTSQPKSPIRLDFLPNNIEPGKFLKVSFSYPATDHVLYGKADLQGEIDLILPQGSFPVSNFYTMEEVDQDEILRSYVRRMRKLDEDLDEDDLKIRFRDWLTICCLIFPTEDVRTRIFQSVSDIFAIIFHLDDLVDDEEIMHQVSMTTAAFYRNYENWHALFDTGNTDYYNKIALQFPLLKTGLSALAVSVEEIATYIPGIRENLKFPNRALFESSESVPLVTLDMECEGDMLSEEALKVVRGLNAGFQMPLEFIAAVQGVRLPDKVRQSLLFEIFVNGYNLAAGLFNDIFGLNKDMVKHASTDNCILRRVMREKKSLKESFEQTLKLLKDTTKDTRLAGRKLKETFRDEPSVAAFIRIAEHIFDGQIYSYLLLFKLKGRYGSIDFKIVSE